MAESFPVFTRHVKTCFLEKLLAFPRKTSCCMKSRDGIMRWIHHDKKHIVSKSNQLRSCNKIHIVSHKMEPASQKETSPLDRKAINSLPHKSSAFVPQCIKNGAI